MGAFVSLIEIVLYMYIFFIRIILLACMQRPPSLEGACVHTQVIFYKDIEVEMCKSVFTILEFLNRGMLS